MQRLFLFLLVIYVSCLHGQTDELLKKALTAPVARQAEIAIELQKYPRSDFDAAAAQQIDQILNQDASGGRKEFILLLGFLEEERRLLSLREIPALKPFTQSINLALVRAGNRSKQENLLENIRRYPVNDDFVYTVVPLLTYTRQREVIDFLWQQATSENMNCKPADAETDGRIDCAFRIVEFLAPVIENFPVEFDEEGDFLTADYPKALAEIRRWYAVHSQDYRIITNTF